MDWFKHDSGAHMDAKLRRLRLKYGMEGYGLYWYCLELIAKDVKATNITFELEHDSEIIAHDTGINYKLIEEMITYMVELQLFENSGGIITCIKMAKRLDQSMTGNQKMRGMIAKIKQSHDPVMTDHDGVMISHDSVMQEEKRREKKRVYDPKQESDPKLNADAWVEWCEFRSADKKKKITATAAGKQIKLLTSYSKSVQQRIVDHSIQNDYQGLFPPKDLQTHSHDGSGYTGPEL